MSIEKYLGQKTDYPQLYDSSILVREERRKNREQYGITGKEFTGVDVWNCYEISFLRENGVPMTCVAKIVYSSRSEFIVESKSLKLYLNSFNMTKFRGSEGSCLARVQSTISTDLEKLLGVKIRVTLFLEAFQPILIPVYSDFQSPLEQFIDMSREEIVDFNENPDLLYGEEIDEWVYDDLFTTLLRSNCKVTHQPDWGNLYVRIRSKYKISKIGFLKYIISFRNEYHFHEEVVEMIFKRLLDKFSPAELMVGAIYCRRGGCDICPIRATHAELMDNNLIQSYVLNTKKLRQ